MLGLHQSAGLPMKQHYNDEKKEETFMIKLMIIGRRRAGITRRAMQHHMLNIHAPLVLEFIAAHPAEAPKRYAQNHFIDATHALGSPAESDWALDRDFVTQVWATSPAEAMAALALPFYQEKLRPDEENFVDQSTVSKFMVQEELVFCDKRRTARHKLFFVLPAAPEAAAEDGPRAEQFAEVVARVVADRRTPYISRHVRNRVMNPPSSPASVDLIEEFWLDDADSAERLLALLTEGLASDATAPGLRQVMQHGMASIALEHALYQE
ncbi:hypothetical protein RC54_04375 [Herbaspirillum rubrisubalbicans]|uniref:EthD domain-containing protein n=2 Tax=Herbaspirillum rubrisubalbicans TaxID=80842 RepID=A0AAD0U4Q7_9BURK|nr:hypothetical protein RC54_04375 [Herbaspirillum rubrisubalbicans]